MATFKQFKPSRELARMLIRDIAKSSGLKFSHPDRLTQSEVQAVASWARTDPRVQAVMRDQRHPMRPNIDLHRELLVYFGTMHPQDGSLPRPWPLAQATGRSPTPDDLYADLTPADAEARLIYHRTLPDYQAGMRDGRHPDHAEYVAQTLQLQQIAAAEHPPAAAPAAEVQRATEARAQIDTLLNDPQFQREHRDRRHPNHQAALDRLSALYEKAYPDERQGTAGGASASSEKAPSASSPSAEALYELNRLRVDSEFQAAYGDRSHTGHKAAIDRMSALYAAAYPEPAENSEGGDE